MRTPLFGFRDDAAIVFRDLGRVIPVVGWMAVASLVVALVFGESYTVLPLSITAAASFFLGALFYLPFRRSGEARLRHAMLTAALAWLIVPLVGALPFILVASASAFPARLAAGLAPFRNPASAFFEAVSGFTGTGLSMATRPDLLPHALQWWRSFSEWVGGMGVIVVVLTILAGPKPGLAMYSLYYAEARTEKIHPSVKSTVFSMWWIFVLYTGASAVALWAFGMPVWHAINQAMVGVATGGFSLTPNGTAAYRSVGIELVLMASMLVGAISFSMHYEMLRGEGRKFWRDYQTRALFAFVALGIVALTLENLGTIGGLNALRLSAFHFVSAATTTGFQGTDFGSWSEAAKLILALGMFIGGAAGSTAGGIKLIRLLTLVKGIRWRFRQIVSPRGAIVPLRIGTTPVREGEVGQRLEDAAMVTLLWLVFLAVGVVALLHTVPSRFSLADVILEVTSAQGNAGLSTGITSPTMTLAGKLSLCFNMWVGRLEIIPALMLLRTIFRFGG
ncbi:MAG: TrkH family potassium uptake protein [Candidatus Bipolaricaulota bacterium]